jgi:hypothetical protein
MKAIMDVKEEVVDEDAKNPIVLARKEESELSVMKKFIKCFVPFNDNNKLAVGNCLYFPNRLLAGSLLSVVSVAYIAY